MTEPTPPAGSRRDRRVPPAVPPMEGPSPDVSLAAEASPLPGAHRGGFLRLPTAPVNVTIQSAPGEPGTEQFDPLTAQWLRGDVAGSRGVAGWALAFSIAGLIVALFVGWGFPIGLVGIITAIVSLRRPTESRAIAVWALILGAVSVMYSALWLLWAASRSELLI